MMFSRRFAALVGLILLSWLSSSVAARPRKVHVSYPIDLLGTNSDTYSGNLTLDKLTCFGNRDYGVPTYKETMLCMIRMPLGFNCHSIWGSRSVVVEVTGSVEFLKLNRLPAGSVFNEFISLNATRWLELAASSSSVSQREVRHVPAEPIYLCARSNDWRGSPAKFHITFRPVFLRERDKQLCHSKTLVHILLVTAVTSIWLLPYIAAVFARQQAAGGIEAHPAGARQIHFAPGVEVGEVELGATRAIERLHVRCQLDQITTDETRRQSEVAKKLDEQPAGVATGTAEFGERFFR